MQFLMSLFVGLLLGVSVSAESLLEGRVRLDSGAPVADAQVRLFDMTDLRQGAVARAQTDGTGYFALSLAASSTGRALPARFALGQNYPNPFNPSTIIPYQLAASSQVRLEVFNLLGQRIATLVDGERPAGFHTATWTATDGAGRAVGAGVYIYRMTVGMESQTGRMVLLDGQAGLATVGAVSVMPGASGVGVSNEAEAHVYGLIVSGRGLAPYVDSSFRVEGGMAPVELVVSSGSPSAGKVMDDDCALCDLFAVFNDQQEEEADETEEEEAETDSTSSEGGPDLIVQSPSVSATVLTPGEAFTLNATVHNQGDEQAAATMLHYYRSNNATITASDTEVGTDAIGTLDASATSEASIALTAPTGISPEVGIYYGACVASVSGESNTDNNCSTAVRITVSGQETTEEEEETPEEDEVEASDTPEEESDNTPVTIPDANLRAAIAKALGKASGATITVAEMKTLTELEAHDSGISDLTGLEFATNLSYLNLSSWELDDLPDNNISDISSLAGLTSLETLWLGGNNITDISALSGLTNLTELDLQLNSVSDISALSGLTKLTFLKLGYNNLTLFDYDLIPTPENSGITDISALAGLTNLTVLELQYNNISDISALSGLTNLNYLILQVNNISDISALSGLTSLVTLYLSATNITDISALSGLTNLNYLNLEVNSISDISALSGLTNLRYLVLNFNNISDISPLSGLTNLTELDLWGNNISDISPLSGLTNLTELGLPDNNISDISALSGLTNLTELDLWGNNISDISALSGLTNLTWLDLDWNFLNDFSLNDHIPALKSRGVTVFFTRFRRGDFDIELVFLDDFTEDQKNVLRLVARRWMSVITEDLPDYTFTQGWSGQCGDHSYTIPSGERIDDLRIYMTTFDGDDRDAVGWGGPDLLREETHLPVLGCMGFDLKRANLLITGLHEIGHVLGFGTVWDDLGLRQNPNGDTHFNGPRAIAAFNDAGGRNYTGAKVPVEKMDGGHWRGDVFEQGELMLPWGGGALSAITVQSLADLGYGVDVTQADPYTLPGAAGKASAKIAATMPSISGVDIIQADVYALPGTDPHWQGRIARGLPLLPGDDRLKGRLESAEWIGGRGFDLRDGRLMGRMAPSLRAVPELSCGVGLRQEPIHVIDPQGRIVRTLDD